MGTDLNRREFRVKLRYFANKLDSLSDPVVLFYFGGHAIKLNGENYLLPCDADIRRELDVEFEGINLKRVFLELGNTPSLKMVILDACRLSNIHMQFHGTAFDGLAPVTPPAGVVLIFSTAPLTSLVVSAVSK